EFKAILAHEFGHFSQRSLRLSGYTHVVYRAIDDMVHAEDYWDRWVIQGLDTPWVSAFAVPLYTFVATIRALLKGTFRAICKAELSLLRQMEFNADLVAVSVAGSDAPIHALLKSDFCQDSLRRAAHDLVMAAEHRLFSRDLFFHLDLAAE